MPAPDLDRTYTDHAASVFAFALTLTRAEGAAREVVQEVFVKLALADPATPIHDLRRYLLRIAHHCVIDRRRQDVTRQRTAAALIAKHDTWFAPAVVWAYAAKESN